MLSNWTEKLQQFINHPIVPWEDLVSPKTAPTCATGSRYALDPWVVPIGAHRLQAFQTCTRWESRWESPRFGFLPLLYYQWSSPIHEGCWHAPPKSINTKYRTTELIFEINKKPIVRTQKCGKSREVLPFNSYAQKNYRRNDTHKLTKHRLPQGRFFPCWVQKGSVSRGEIIKYESRKN